jgi:hypothetical protein
MAFTVSDDPKNDIVKVCVNWVSDQGHLNTRVAIVMQATLDEINKLLDDKQVV